MSYFKGLLGYDNPEAEDLASEVMLKAWISYPKFEGKSTVKNWIHRIAINKYRDYYRRKKIITFHSLNTGYRDKDNQDWAEILLLDENPNPEESLIRDELRKSVRIAVNDLKHHHKEVITLHYFEGKEVEEIAKILKVPSGTIKSRLFRAREVLQKVFQKTFDKEDSEY